MLKINSKRNVLGTTRGAHLGEEHVKWLLGCVEVLYQERPLPHTQGPTNALKLVLKRTWYQARKHFCAKARLRNAGSLEILITFLCSCVLLNHFQPCRLLDYPLVFWSSIAFFCLKSQVHRLPGDDLRSKSAMRLRSENCTQTLLRASL